MSPIPLFLFEALVRKLISYYRRHSRVLCCFYIDNHAMNKEIIFRTESGGMLFTIDELLMSISSSAVAR